MEHLLNGLVKAMPQEECYLEVGTLEGRTLDAAAYGNDGKHLLGCDPCLKYNMLPESFGPNVTFVQAPWQEVLKIGLSMPVGCAFYDGLHDASETTAFMLMAEDVLSDEAIVVLDDWDRVTVREGAYRTDPKRWRLLNEMPSFGDGLTCPQDHFGYSFGVSVWGFRRD